MIIYYTAMQHRQPVQITWEDIFFDNVDSILLEKMDKPTTGTVTLRLDLHDPSDNRKYLRAKEKVNVDRMIKILRAFNAQNKYLFEKDRKNLYTHTRIPKKTGGWRPIDEPTPNLQNALRNLSYILTYQFGLLYHTSAFAYMKGRCTVDSLRKHQSFGSNWFLKTDFSGFFPHTTLDFVMRMMEKIFPMSEVCKDPEGKAELEKALSLGFLDGGLPQGTCLSPCLTNIMMIPIDFTISQVMTARKLCYTRYADDMLISGEEKFPWKEIVNTIRKVLNAFDAPYELKDEKTRFGSKAGSNWNLGLMLNKDNNITVGYRNKKYFKAEMTNFILDTKNGKRWDIGDVTHLRGLLSYYMMVEKDYFTKVIRAMESKWNVNVNTLFKCYPI